MPKLEVVNANNVIEFNPQKANFKLKNTGGPKGDTGAQGPQGPKGETGAQGPAGASASVTVGSTTTLSPGADATVTNSGDTRNAILNFGIPTGARGPKGDTGSKGDTGPIGPKGAKGDTGAAATVQVGNTNTGAPGTNAQVTNAGNEHFAVFNFTIPRGDKGEKGATGAQGPKGPAGQDGTDGFSPIATVTQEGLDAEISITDKNGTTTATVPGFGVQVVESLPATGSSNVIYLERDSNSASGNPISIADAVQAPLKSLNIKGNTGQQTYSGKNLYSAQKTQTTTGGITYSIENGVMKINGTRTEASNLGVTFPITYKANTTYTCSVRVVSGSLSFDSRWGSQVTFGNVDGSKYVTIYDAYAAASKMATVSFTPTADTTTDLAFWFGYESTWTNKSFNNIVVEIQVEANSSATSFEPYVGGVPAPNPDYPQAVQTVTGENVVKICGKNLFDKTTATQNYRLGSDGLPYGDNQYYLSDYISVSQDTAYYISGTSGAAASSAVCFYASDKSFISRRIYGDWYLFTTPANTAFIRFTTQKTNDINGIQLELGSTATAYEPYQGQSYEVNLGKNLFDATNLSPSATLIATVSNKTNNGFDINTTVSQSSQWSAYVEYTLNLDANTTYTISRTASVVSGSSYSNYGAMRTHIGSTYGTATTASNLTFTTGATGTVGILFYAAYNQAAASGSTVVRISNLQLEKGSQATSYAAYFEPIELCKIGDYQDYIWNDNGTWKIHKAINKSVLDSSEGWAYAGQTNVYYSAGIVGYALSDNAPFADYLKGVDNVSGAAAMSASADNSIAFISSSAATRLYIKSSTLGGDTTGANLRAWLSTHNVSLYYALATPTDTEITNEALVAQLEAILAGGTQAGANTIALTPSAGATGTLEVEYYDSYDSYLWVNNRWEKFAHLG